MLKHNTGLRRQARKIIFNVFQFMEKEKEEGVKDVKAANSRVSKATGTSERTVRRILAEGKTSEMISVFRTPGKNRVRAKWITGLDNFDLGTIKRCIHHFHVTEKQMVTIKRLLEKLQNILNFEGSATSLRKIVKDLGFKWRQTDSNKKILIEKMNTRLKRIEYLDKIKKYREEKRPIVFMDELYMQSMHNQSDQDMKRPLDKGQRIVIVHAGSEVGFVPNALHMFQLAAKSGDRQDEMTFTNYEKWIRKQLIPNLCPNSVVVMDKAPYHNKLLNPTPTSNSRKAEMETWLGKKGVSYDTTLLKPQLYDLIQENQDTHKNYVLDNIFSQFNHSILRLPPYHPDLNPIEIAWAAVKGYVAANNKQTNVERNADRTMELVKQKLDMIWQKEWAALCERVKEVEEEYRKSDRVIDEMTERLNIREETENSSESESESESDSDSYYDEDENLPSTSAR